LKKVLTNFAFCINRHIQFFFMQRNIMFSDTTTTIPAGALLTLLLGLALLRLLVKAACPPFLGRR